MRKPSLLLLLSVITIALPLSAAQGRDQSYFTFDDGGTIVRQAEDSREIDARVNLPIFTGDEVITSRRGRAEIRLADGNIIALDRSTDVRLRSILDSYDAAGQQTIVELRYGHIAVQRTDFNQEALRLDTQNASYTASDQAVYAVDTDSRGADRVTVFNGEIEVRTPTRTTSVREGEEGRVDAQGLYGLVSLQRDGADEFERWFIRRSERYGGGNSRYLDRSLAYSDHDLEQYGSWTYVSGIGTWGWRPYVSAGWRPYYYGNWMYGPGGSLVWISGEPWGWVPYHYGRWAYDGIYGWVWVPGYTYSPAWVYWLYGPGYFGWAPAGWFDCYRPYYGWAYRPYQRAGFDFGFGFYGRVRVGEIDLRPWTFVSPHNIISARVDQAALTTDAIRQRLLRDPSAGLATVGATPARFTRSEIKDPATAINTIARRGIGSGTGREGSGSVTDMTPFFRRDPELSNSIRERIVRSGGAVVPPSSGGIAAPPSRFQPSGVPSPGTPGTLEGRIPARGDKEEGGRIDRNTGGRSPGRDDVSSSIPQPSPSTIDRGSTPRGSGSNWRNRIERPAPAAPPAERPSIDRTAPPADRTVPPPPSRDESWRGRVTGRRDVETPSRESIPRNNRAPVERGAPPDRGSDIPRRIIDRIGGARIYSEPSRESAPRERAAPSSRESAPSHIERSSPPSREHSSSPPPSRSSGEGGHVKRN